MRRRSGKHTPPPLARKFAAVQHLAVTLQLRAFRPEDADEVTQVAVDAFAEFDDSHGEWPTPAPVLTIFEQGGGVWQRARN